MLPEYLSPISFILFITINLCTLYHFYHISTVDYAELFFRNEEQDGYNACKKYQKYIKYYTLINLIIITVLFYLSGSLLTFNIVYSYSVFVLCSINLVTNLILKIKGMINYLNLFLLGTEAIFIIHYISQYLNH